MAAFVLVPGAGGEAWYWHRVVPLLEAAGHEAVAVDLPGDDPAAGLDVYADRVVAAAGDRPEVVLVAQSMAGFTAPLACARLRVSVLVFLNAMIPLTGEAARDWGKHTKSTEARVRAAERGGYSTEFDEATYFLHDLPDALAKEAGQHARPEADIAFGQACRFERWPDVPIHVLVADGDRLFPPELQARVAQERLGKGVESVRGGHLVALSNPGAVVERLIAHV